MTMKIYLDDLRATPDTWTRAHTVEEAQELLRNNVVTNMSLDHDLGASYICKTCGDNFDGEDYDCEDGCSCDCHYRMTPTGYDLVKWCAENDIWSVYKPTVHSANPVGRANMQAVIDRYWHPPEENKQ
jgi:hypothetical protein